MKHWLDEAAAGLSSGRLSRRDVLRRGGRVAAGGLLVSLPSPLAALARGGCPCKAGEFCCDGACFPRGPRLGCCHESTYDPSLEKCCPHGRQACFKDETCCGLELCCTSKEQCVGTGKTAQCVPKKQACNPYYGNGTSYVPCPASEHNCCYDVTKRTTDPGVCCKGTCCGANGEVCCDKGTNLCCCYNPHISPINFCCACFGA
jgi:hypothetical protein